MSLLITVWMLYRISGGLFRFVLSGTHALHLIKLVNLSIVSSFSRSRDSRTDKLDVLGCGHSKEKDRS